MNNDVKTDWLWADRYLPVIKNILTLNACGLVDFQIAPLHVDMKNATDIVLNMGQSQIAVRVRRDNCQFRDLTVRSRRASGAETELAKLKNGFANWYLYCWTDKQQNICDWILVDLDQARLKGVFDIPRKEITNTDNKTWFVSINYKELKQDDCLIAFKVGLERKLAIPPKFAEILRKFLIN